MTKMTDSEMMAIIKKMLSDNGYKTATIDHIDNEFSIMLDYDKIKSESLKGLMCELFGYFYMD